MSTRKHIFLNKNITELTKLATAVEEFSEQVALTTRLQFNLNLALDELVTNIISYAHDDNGINSKIDVTLELSNDKVRVTLIDNGRAFDPTTAQTIDFKSSLDKHPIGGLGIHFAKTLIDKMTYSRSNGKNRLQLEKNLAI